MAYADPPAGQAAAAPAAYANWGQRVGAYLIDVAPVIGGYIVMAILDAIIRSFVFAALLYLVFAVGSLGWTVYNRWMTMGGTGQSLGKRVVGLQLVSERTGQPVGPAMAFVRDLAHIVDGIICFVGYLFPLWDLKRQTLADKIMTTVVVPA
jgi:uncharacterized RDD family membrane protein YckC